MGQPLFAESGPAKSDCLPQGRGAAPAAEPPSRCFAPAAPAEGRGGLRPCAPAAEDLSKKEKQAGAQPFAAFPACFGICLVVSGFGATYKKSAFRYS